MARFEKFAEYFLWDDSDKLFQLRDSLVGADGQILWYAGKQSTVSQIIAVLKARFGRENQAERFRAELRSRKRTKGESVQTLYQDFCLLMSFAYPDESSALSNIVERDAFLKALDDQALRVRIVEKEPKTWTTLSIWPADWKRSILWGPRYQKQRKENEDSYVPWPASRNPLALGS